MSRIETSFAEYFLAAAAYFPDRPAVEFEGNCLTYQKLAQSALALAATLQRLGMASPVGLFARNSIEAYQGLAGILLSGLPYLPLNPANPENRTLECLGQARSTILVVDGEGWEAIAPSIIRFQHLTILRMDSLSPADADLGVVYLDPKARESEWKPPSFCAESTAYIIFTSGSEGTPKGVRITHSNVAAAIATIHQ